MDNALERDMATLANPNAGFVARRDAARRLGEHARRAWSALEQQREDKDSYVRAAVASALSGVPDAEVLSTAVDAKKSAPDLRALAEACSNGSPPELRGDGYVVSWKLPSGRTQRVCLSPYTDREGRALIRVYTYCGKPTAEATAWVLRNNAKLVRCAFALHRRKQEDYLILTNNIAAEDATEQLMRQTVETIATHGDYLESKLSGLDEF